MAIPLYYHQCSEAVGDVTFAVYLGNIVFFFFFKQKTAYEISECDWSSDVCSSDLKQKTARSEEHTSELQSHSEISYAVFCLKKKNTIVTLEKLIELIDAPASADTFFFFNDTATTEIYTLSYTLSLHDALPISSRRR